MAFGHGLVGVSSVVRLPLNRRSRKIFWKLKPVQKVAANSGISPHIWSPGSRRISRVTVQAAPVSDLVAGRNGSPGMSDCQGELSALFTSLKKVGANAPRLCNPANLYMRIPHRSGRTLFSSRFRSPTTLVRLRLLEVSPTYRGVCRA